MIARGATPYDAPLICHCNDDPFGNGPCVDCRKAIVAARAVAAFRRHVAREDALAASAERDERTWELGMHPDDVRTADGGVECVICEIAITPEARLACATCAS
jgi:hypothetical protein